MPKAVKHNSVEFISPVKKAHQFRRTIAKRGRGLNKKAMEFASISGGSVFLSIQLFDRPSQRDTTATFTSRSDRDWKKHLTKILASDKNPIRLDTSPQDYVPIHQTKKTQTVRPPKGCKTPWFCEGTHIPYLLPQLMRDFTKKKEDLSTVSLQAEGEVKKYFGTDKEELEDSRIIECSMNNEENAETKAVVYSPGYFRPLRPHWKVAQFTGKEVRYKSWNLLHDLMKGRRPR